MKSRVTLIAAACVMAACQQEKPAAPPARQQAAEPGLHVLEAGSPKLERLKIETVANAEFPVDEVVAPGKVETNPNRIARVVPPVAGKVRELLVRLGDAVKEGQTLALIESPDASVALAAQRQAVAGLRQARSAQAKAEKDFARLKDLVEHRAAAVKDVQAAENDLVQAQAAVEQAQATLEDSARRLELLGMKTDGPAVVPVKAPISGKVLEISVAPGEYRADLSTPLLVVADLSSVWISADVPETLIRRVEAGEVIQVELSAFPGESWRGRVTRIADTVDPETRAIKVQAEIPNPGGRLRPEMFGRIRHQHGLGTRPAVPVGAVVQKDGSSVVLKQEAAGRFREVPVAAGARRDGLVAIESGLQPGDRVVTDGAMLLGRE